MFFTLHGLKDPCDSWVWVYFSEKKNSINISSAAVPGPPRLFITDVFSCIFNAASWRDYFNKPQQLVTVFLPSHLCCETQRHHKELVSVSVINKVDDHKVAIICSTLHHRPEVNHVLTAWTLLLDKLPSSRFRIWFEKKKCKCWCEVNMQSLKGVFIK